MLMHDLWLRIVGVSHRVSPYGFVGNRDHPTGPSHRFQALTAPVSTDLWVQLSAQISHLSTRELPHKIVEHRVGNTLVETAHHGLHQGRERPLFALLLLGVRDESIGIPGRLA